MMLGTAINPGSYPSKFWKCVRETQNMCTAVNVPFNNEQKLFIAEGVLCKTQNYKQEMKDWEDGDPTRRTCNNFVIYINDAYLRKKKEEMYNATSFGNFASGYNSP